MVSPAQLYQAIQPMMKTAAPDDIRQTLAHILAIFPDFAQGHNDLGVLNYQAGEKEKARRHYEQAAQLEPANITFQKNLADFYYVELGLVEEALRIYVRVLELKPEDVETLLVTGHICVAVHKFEDAVTFYRRVLDLEPGNDQARDNLKKIETHLNKDRGASDPDSLYREAQDLVQNNDLPAAIDKLRQLVDAFPDYAVAHNDLGVLLYQAGDKDSAGRFYGQAYERQPQNITFAKNLAEFYYVEQGRVEEALQIYVDILATNPEDVDTLMMTGHICASLKKSDDARVFYQRVLEIEPWKKQAADCLDRLNTPCGDNACSPGASAQQAYETARELTENGRADEAAAVLENLVREKPDFAVAHNDLGVLYLQAGQTEKALFHYERAAALDPVNIIFKKNLAEYFWVHLGRHKDAMEIYVDILKLAPEDIETLLSVGNVCLALEKFDDARTFFERVLEIEPWNAAAGEKIEELDRRSRVSQTG